MNVLVAVIDDLWRFAYQSLFGSVLVTELTKEREVQVSISLIAKKTELENSLFSNKEIASQISVDEYRVGDQYFIGEVDTHLYSDPVIAFDTAVKDLPYGQSVLLKKIGGRWAEVETASSTGWVLKDSLALRREDVLPSLVEDVVYDAHHAETIKLRAAIGDEFGGARADLPLSAAEFVTYKLQQHKLKINWNTDSPRVAGSWQFKLKGVNGIHMTVIPKTHTIMEYSLEDIGYLAFVEAVFPDSSVKITQVGFPEDGYYREVILTQEEYREFRPVFIEVA